MDSKLKEQLNFYLEYKDWYFRIINDFKFDYEEDCKARDYLTKILDLKKNEWNLEELLFSFKKGLQEKSFILIYGCGPTLEETVEYLLRYKGKDIFKTSINLAADGASVFLKEKSIPINAIFTDLDGITINEFNYPKFLIIHAHGDNIDKIRFFRKSIIRFKKVIGTTQVEPNANVINPGGFTDGDRILFFLRGLLAPFHKLFLIGMDFKNVVGKYSKFYLEKNQVGSPIKQKKLHYALELINWIKKRIKNEIYFINSTLRTNNFTNLSIKEFITNYINKI
ncbi:hypothetical protein LCGC14_0965880 [marine sediment metagenome]|uniref:6-hydroxymethylpterin diphosphokinase MptE-like domain-containing protein n=1 Tax=marine sediment metagenome TaxID=412755 RepID=A0A0F9ND87_9ZZZZ